MKVYRQEEWIKAYEENHEGHLLINGANIDREGRIKSLRTTTSLTATLEAWGGIDASCVGVEGSNKQFVLKDGEIQLVVDSSEIYRFEPVAPCELINPHIIPFQTWLKDWKDCWNSHSKRAEDRIDKIRIDGCELDAKGRIRWINSSVTWEKWYGPFGQLTTERSIEVGRDVMCGTYGMHRHELARDDWEPNCCGDHGHRAYFTKGFDVLWSDDGRYDEVSNQYYRKVKKVEWKATA